MATKRINELYNTPGVKLWQRNYYEHVIRGEDDLNRIRKYIKDNPARWSEDEENPDFIPAESLAEMHFQQQTLCLNRDRPLPPITLDA